MVEAMPATDLPARQCVMHSHDVCHGQLAGVHDSSCGSQELQRGSPDRLRGQRDCNELQSVRVTGMDHSGLPLIEGLHQEEVWTGALLILAIAACGRIRQESTGCLQRWRRGWFAELGFGDRCSFPLAEGRLRPISSGQQRGQSMSELFGCLRQMP